MPDLNGGWGVAETDLGGPWMAAEANEDLRRTFPRPDLDDANWQPLAVPGHWRSEPAFAASDGPLFYRKRFEMEALADGQRAWLTLDGIFYQSDVWLDGSYLGDTEGYFFPHSFDITSALEARSEHVLALEVVCDRPPRTAAKRSLLGVFGYWDCMDPSYNPGGIWAPVSVAVSGPVHMSSLRVLCVEADAKSAVLDLSVVLDSVEAATVTLRTEVRRSGAAYPEGLGDVEVTEPAARAETRQPLAVGANRVRWRLAVDDPDLWWPVGLGRPSLYDVCVTAELAGEIVCSRTLRTGLRDVRAENLVWSVNGERVFLKGANLGPTRRDLAYASPGDVAGDVRLAAEAGLNFLRVHAHIGRRELYDAADELGVLLWQDMPLHRGYTGVRRQAVRQVAAAVDLLGHHPSILVWCGHDEPFSHELPAGRAPGPTRVFRSAVAQALPGWNKSVLDTSIKRALERADPTRPVLAHSGALPHPAWGTDSHLYFGWYHGHWDDLPRAMAVWPAAGRFVGELGAQAVPYSADFLEPERWPHLDWDRLARHFCLQKTIFDDLVPPSRYASFEEWRDATQAYQARLVRFQVESLRRLQFRPTGGFAVFLLNDCQPAVSWSLLDHERVPKAAYGALRQACAPVLVAADWPAPSYRPGGSVSLDVHVVNDLLDQLAGAVVEARLAWPGGGRKWLFGGDVPANSCSFVGTLNARLPRLAALEADTGGSSPHHASWPLELRLELRWGSPAQSVSNHYESQLEAPHRARR
jgi:beta-mannosidase